MGIGSGMTETVTDIAVIVLGLITCFWGYKLFKFSITVIGGYVGYRLGSSAVRILLGVTDDIPGVAVMLIPLAFMLVFGILAFAFYKKAFIFAVAFVAGRALYDTVISTKLFPDMGTRENIILIVVCIVVGLAAGFACFLIQKGAIIVFTGLVGAYLAGTASSAYLLKAGPAGDICSSLTSRLFKTSIEPQSAVIGLVTLILAVLGILVQTKRRK